MLRVACAPRPCSLRCAYCHDDLADDAWICQRCATRLHAECRAASRACTTLGCVPRVVVHVPPGEQPIDSAVWPFLYWISVFFAAWSALIWCSAIDFVMQFRSLPPLTRGLVELALFARRPLGVEVAASIIVVSTVCFVRLRRHRATAAIFRLLAWLAVLFFPTAVVAVIVKLANVALV